MTDPDFLKRLEHVADAPFGNPSWGVTLAIASGAAMIFSLLYLVWFIAVA